MVGVGGNCPSSHYRHLPIDELSKVGKSTKPHCCGQKTRVHFSLAKRWREQSRSGYWGPYVVSVEVNTESHTHNCGQAIVGVAHKDEIERAPPHSKGQKQQVPQQVEVYVTMPVERIGKEKKKVHKHSFIELHPAQIWNLGGCWSGSNSEPVHWFSHKQTNKQNPHIQIPHFL